MKHNYAGILAVLGLISLLILSGCSQASDKTNPEEVFSQKEGESLSIPMSELSETAKFYKISVDGMAMEVIAVKASDGSFRTVFNTCQICYDSGRGYYKQQGEMLVCQNCGNRFAVDLIEVEMGGCNPWPIFPKDKTITDTSIEIPYDVLLRAKSIFANWKRVYG